jgi:molybdopterin-binding protein
MQLSTRNRLPGTITEVVKGEAAAKVTLQVGDNHLVALITRESADELGLEPGKQATALVKATDVMILTEGGDLACERDWVGALPQPHAISYQHSAVSFWFLLTAVTACQGAEPLGNPL